MKPEATSKRDRPDTARISRRLLTAWMVSVVMVPTWVNIDAGVTIPIQCILGLIAVAIAFSSGVRVRLTKLDLYFAAFLLVGLATASVGEADWAWWAQIFVRMGIPFLTARVLISSAGLSYTVNLITVTFGLVALLALVEVLTAWHPYTEWQTSSLEYTTWSGIQVRAGRDRSEWAFGHSIALGGSLVLAIPFVMRSKYSALTKTGILALIIAGLAATGSRGALISGALTTGLVLLYGVKNHAIRTIALTISLVGMVLLIPVVDELISSQAEANLEQRTSIDYRQNIYTLYFSEIRWLGQSAVAQQTGSIDSTILHFGLQFGWLMLIVILMPLIASALRLITGHASIAEIALIGQVPLFATVALITQYQFMTAIVIAIAIQMTVTPKSNAPTNPHGDGIKPRNTPATILLEARTNPGAGFG